MRCTCFKKAEGLIQQCKNETGRSWPKELDKFKDFNPKILYIFFKNTEKENNIIPHLDALVCDKHIKEWKEYLKRSSISTKAAKKRKQKLEPDYSI